MPKTIYTPPADSLASSVVNFFRNNPDEQLTVDDIADKFDVGHSSVHTQLSPALEAHLLHRGKNEDGQYVYAAGTALAVKPSWKKTSAAAPAKRVRIREHAVFDLETVKIEANVPVWPKSADKTQQLRKLVIKLSASQSCALPMHTRTVLAKIITEQHNTTAQRFTVRKIAADQIRLWRTA